MRDEAQVGADELSSGLKTCVFLVAGMHRSGTSALTRVINLLGVTLPPNLMPAHHLVNARGFWESLDVVGLNDRILAGINSEWDDCMPIPADWFASPAGEAAQEDIRDLVKSCRTPDRPLVIKDPRICRLLPSWLGGIRHIPGEPLVLISVRHPLEVAASLDQRDGINEGTALYLWLRHIIDAEKWSRSTRRAFVRYDDLLADWRGTMTDAATTLDICWPAPLDAAAAEIDAFLDSALRRQVETGDLIPGKTEIHTHCQTVWRWLRDGARDESRDVLENIAERLHPIESVLAPIAGSMRLKVRRANEAEQKALAGAAALHHELQQVQQVAQAETVALRNQLEHTRQEVVARADMLQAIKSANAILEEQVANACEAQLAASREARGSSVELARSLEAQLAVAREAQESSLALARSLEGQLTAIRKSEKEGVARVLSLEMRAAELDDRVAVQSERIVVLEEQLATSEEITLAHVESTRARDFADAAARRQAAEIRDRLGRSLLKSAGHPRRLAPPPGASLLRRSRLFDRAWYLQRYEDAADSGMDPVDHYLLHGAAAGYDPHPLFSTSWYLGTNLDVAKRGINPLVHYIRAGGAERRAPHPLFDGALYAEAYGHSFAPGQTPLEHYLAAGGKAGLRPHWLFDAIAYLAAYPDAAEGRRTPLEHYVLQGEGTLLRPHWAFDPEFYLRDNAAARESKMTPLEYFARFWPKMTRDPGADFNMAAYLDEYDEVRLSGENPLVYHVRGCDYERVFGAIARQPNIFPAADTETRPAAAFANLLVEEFGAPAREATIGLMQRFRLPFTAERFRPALPGDKELAVWTAEVERLDAARDKPDSPDVSIVIPVYNQLTFTLACIRSILEWPSRYSYEIIVGDDCSDDGTGELFAAGVGSIRHVRGRKNKGFIGNCNAAAAEARGRYVVFLNNDTVVLPGWLEEMIGALEADASIGLAGSKLLYPDGRLQECGGIIWRDGSAWNFGRYDDPRKPEYNYLRDVDYVSGASIALSRALWEKLGGFDTHYDIAYGEDSDLALKIRYRERLRVVVQPLSQLVHFEGISSGTDETTGVKAYQVGNARKLAQRWETELRAHRPNGERPELEKERPVGKRVLVIDHCTPTPDQDAGSLTCLEIMRAFQSNGYKVTFIPETNFHWMRKESRDLQRIGIEPVYGPYYRSVKEYLRRYGSIFDDVLIFRNGAAGRNLATVRRLARQANVIFHTSDLHFLREQRLAELTNAGRSTQSAVKKSQKRELDIIAAVDLTIVHSTFEEQVLAELVPSAKVYVFPWILDTYGRRKPFAARSGLIFLGGYRHPPNVDAVRYFASEIWPAVRRELPDITFYAAGANPPEELLELDGKDGVVVTGFIPDLGDYFDAVRLSVAPIRYGAGIKGKVGVSLSYGVPCIATECAAEGMGLVDGENIVVADDPGDIARAIIALYRDEARWTSLSDAGLKFVSDNYARELGKTRVREIVERVRARADQAAAGE